MMRLPLIASEGIPVVRLLSRALSSTFASVNFELILHAIEQWPPRSGRASGWAERFRSATGSKTAPSMSSKRRRSSSALSFAARREPRPDDHSLLAGKLCDDRGNRMSASHASSKGGRRWRYYVSRAALTGRRQDAGSIVRIPASENRRMRPEAAVGRCRRNASHPPAAMFRGGCQRERYASAVTKLSITSLRPARSKSTVSFWPSTPTTLPGPNLR